MNTVKNWGLLLTEENEEGLTRIPIITKDIFECDDDSDIWETPAALSPDTQRKVSVAKEYFYDYYVSMMDYIWSRRERLAASSVTSLHDPRAQPRLKPICFEVFGWPTCERAC